jgi:heme oxygenase
MRQPILNRLREGTSDVHEHLDASLPLARADLDAERYVAILATFRDIQASAARELAGHADGLKAFGYDVADRHEVEWLDNDLTWWSTRLKVQPIETPDTAGNNAVPTLNSTTEAFGWVYVLEGSTLGGQVLVRHIASALNLEPPHGCRYFTGHGADTGPRWRRTCDSLDRIASSWSDDNRDAETRNMVRAARELFTYFDVLLIQK